uniref:HDC14293 n=1 Tax=Drosophila melanogaster TaxID=7227 RepID=Q6IJT4_DROME|nr:TPA_inf: HDC14293 [Drosophila melanogaster]
MQQHKKHNGEISVGQEANAFEGHRKTPSAVHMGMKQSSSSSSCHTSKHPSPWRSPAHIHLRVQPLDVASAVHLLFYCRCPQQLAKFWGKWGASLATRGHFLLAHCYRILQIVMTHVNNVSASPGKAEYVNGNMRMEMEMEMETKQGS